MCGFTFIGTLGASGILSMVGESPIWFPRVLKTVDVLSRARQKMVASLVTNVST